MKKDEETSTKLLLGDTLTPRYSQKTNVDTLERWSGEKGVSLNLAWREYMHACWEVQGFRNTNLGGNYGVKGRGSSLSTTLASLWITDTPCMRKLKHTSMWVTLNSAGFFVLYFCFGLMFGLVDDFFS